LLGGGSWVHGRVTETGNTAPKRDVVGPAGVREMPCPVLDDQECDLQGLRRCMVLKEQTFLYSKAKLIAEPKN
jgi:hypothetical protein